MSAAVDSQRALNGRVNGHRAQGGAQAGAQGGAEGARANGHHDPRPWEQQFLPASLRLDDKIRTQKVTHLLFIASQKP